MSSMLPKQYACHPVPSVDEWVQLWSLWDCVTRQMIPEDQLLTKPIDLRNICLFYLGHIPAFCDIKIVEATGLSPTEPRHFHTIFERGIDPDVDDPTQCHAHSQAPETWPTLDEILTYQDRVRERIRQFYANGAAYEVAWTGRVLWLAFEHEVMHLETLLYMLLQSDKMQAPGLAARPDFEALAVEANRQKTENQWFEIPEQTLRIGLDDPETASGPLRYFGWDVEKPAYTVTVPRFQAKARPISNEEYAQYLIDERKNVLPASWTTLTEIDRPIKSPMASDGNGEVGGHSSSSILDSQLATFIQDKAVRTVYGAVPLKRALDWPVCASYDELASCAKYMGGRIPTEEEARSIYRHAEILKKADTVEVSGQRIPAVNGHLINDGVRESPPVDSPIESGGDQPETPPDELHVDLRDANVGFRHWHPVGVTHRGDRLAGLSEMGGLWEATSSPLTKKPGFGPMKLYPAYSDDFYDNKHFVVLGGSWATHPRVAGRKTFVNWYQRNYRYAWIGARLVRDVQVSE